MIFVILPTRNRLDLLHQNIKCLQNQSYKDICILVIDDGSSDGTKEWLATQNHIISIQGDGNLWWTGAMRKGVEYVLSHANENDFVLTMNDDAEFDNDLIEILLKFHQKLGENTITGSVCFSDRAKQKVVNAGALVRLDDNFGFGTKLALPDNYKNFQPQQVDLLSGKATLIPVKVFQQIGNYDAALPHYGADYEFSYRAKKHGDQPYICYQAEVYNQQFDGGLNEKKDIKSWSDFTQIFFSRRSKRNVFYRLTYLSKTTPWWNVIRGICIIVIEFILYLIKL